MCRILLEYPRSCRDKVQLLCPIWDAARSPPLWVGEVAAVRQSFSGSEWDPRKPRTIFLEGHGQVV